MGVTKRSMQSLGMINPNAIARRAARSPIPGPSHTQVLQWEKHRFAALRAYFPEVREGDWRLQRADQRVQIIKPDPEAGGRLEFGTEFVAAQDRSPVALLGASPGASTAAYIAISVLQKCFPEELTDAGWLPRLKEIIPS